jgi:hypothetical protein
VRRNWASRDRRPPTAGRGNRARPARPVSLFIGEGSVLATSDAAPQVALPPAAPRPARSLLATLERVGSDPLILATALVALVFSRVQWASPSIVGVDGYFHIKYAALMRDQGWRMLLRLEFPWLPTTILNPAEFTDHHLLFHLLLVPFTLFDLRIGAKLAAVVFASSALLVAYHLMAAHRVRYALIWLLVLLASAGPFLYRLSMTRRQALTMVLLLLALSLAFSQRRRWLVPLGFAFSWLFDGFPLLLGVCGAAFLGDWWERRRPDWGLLAYPTLGIMLGTVINPYFPNNVLFSYDHMLPKIVQILGLGGEDVVIRVGSEWYPYSTDSLLRANWLALLLVPLGFVPILVDARPARLRALDGKLVTLALLAVVFLILFLRARRWIEAEPIFAVLFCAFAWNRALPDGAATWLRARLTPGRERLMAVAAAAVVAPLVYLNVLGAMSDVRGTRSYLQYRDAALWLAGNSPPGARVFATDWDDFPELFFWNTHNTYLIGLDPTYMYLHDGPLYLRWRAITRGDVERPGAAIRDEFDAAYVFTDTAHRSFLAEAAADPDLVEVFRNSNTVVFRVIGWHGE